MNIRALETTHKYISRPLNFCDETLYIIDREELIHEVGRFLARNGVPWKSLSVDHGVDGQLYTLLKSKYSEGLKPTIRVQLTRLDPYGWCSDRSYFFGDELSFYKDLRTMYIEDASDLVIYGKEYTRKDYRDLCLSWNTQLYLGGNPVP